ncbi:MULTISPECIES: TolC family protein [Alteromonas]|jgi:outer membrane protein TolC|uniref:Transporter n=1 Tax=Alteromonas mediterranea (strain DSM 17117 / CIP 110805 / LMG 28347 / Deep ecotype) TaxID=1774373 RepID=F2G4L5_ALTMD|nr:MULTISPECIES: TolC family protein [Alteromonas]AGP92072.1 putative cation efflux protein [Alteromonas mediterranea U8]MEE3028000.1 TolC family protein [Pseudomonadota bacterium]AEA96458.1 transporter [Alteromonas mediterranea DE]AGP80265.1 putative cation efflux protein [Alteromonas mediterranea MED64]AGP84090.1 putative cation efflux protein [Alteromonas mediterranea U4]
MNRFCLFVSIWGAFSFSMVSPAIANEKLTLKRAVEIAVENDPWLVGSTHRERATLSSSVVASSLPDPVVNIGLANVPTDGFAFDQEPMTQLKVGVSQMFPRGDSLAIRSRQLREQAAEHPLMRADRVAKARVQVSNLWLEIYRAQQSVKLIDEDKALFEQLSDIAKANYSTAFGRVNQQDIVRAKLELTRLEDRLTKLRALEERATGKLLEWLVRDQNYPSQSGFDAFSRLTLPHALPEIKNMGQNMRTILERRDQQSLAMVLNQHPLILSIEQRIRASQTGIDLAKEKYKPQWGVNASYAYRDDTPDGTSRADFLSMGVSFDVPLFTENRQDQEVSAAVSLSEAIKTDKRLVLREMMSYIQSLYAENERLMERQALYELELLEQMQEQAEASLNAYTNDEGDFAEVVRARIADLNARIDALDISVDLVKTKIQLNYYFDTNAGIPLSQIGEQQ